METERRASVIQVELFLNNSELKRRMMQEEKTKSFPVSKRMVYNSYLKTVSKKGSAGIDRESIEMFNANMSKNLYKIYNRMASGSYFPPAVRTVFIPKKQGGLKTSIRTAIKEVLRTQWSTLTLEWFAEKLNPKIRGWLNYYTRFNRDEAHEVFYYLNKLIRKWIKHKYKIGSKKRLYNKYKLLQSENPLLFYHWKIGIKS